MTILDCCISLKGIKKFGCVGSCGYVPASVKTFMRDIFKNEYFRKRNFHKNAYKYR